MTDMLKTLTALYGPSGNEGEVQAWILAYLREKQIDAHTDALGNIIAKVGGSGKKLVFSSAPPGKMAKRRITARG